MNDFLSLAALFLTAFGAATFLPIQSEIMLLAMSHAGDYSAVILWAVASLGNVLGALLNWYLGVHLHRFAGKKWFPVSPRALNKAEPIYQKWGKWSLLLAWTPFLGDPLTLIAGIFRTSLWWFIPLVTIGKAGRYALLLMI